MTRVPISHLRHIHPFTYSAGIIVLSAQVSLSNLRCLKLKRNPRLLPSLRLHLSRHLDSLPQVRSLPAQSTPRQMSSP